MSCCNFPVWRWCTYKRGPISHMSRHMLRICSMLWNLRYTSAITHKARTLPIKQPISVLSGVSWSHISGEHGFPLLDSVALSGLGPTCAHRKLDPWHRDADEPGEQGVGDDGPLVDGVHDGALHCHRWTFRGRAGGENLPGNDVRNLLAMRHISSMCIDANRSAYFRKYLCIIRIISHFLHPHGHP